jgi:GNAT superfamily N-acetyltransferase
MTTVITGLGAGPPPLPLLHPTRTSGLKIAAASTTHLPAVLAMLARCSRQSLYHRFHGYTDGVAYTQALLARRDDETLLVWSGSACVGMGSVSWDDRGQAHLGVLVEDRWQRLGVGTRLIRALIESVRSRGVTRLHADILGADQFLLRSLRRIGPVIVAIELGTFSVDVELRNRAETEPHLQDFPPTGPAPPDHIRIEPPLNLRLEVEGSRLSA